MPLMPVASLIAMLIDGANHRVERRLSEWHVAAVTLAAGVMLMSESTFALQPYAFAAQVAPQGVWAWTLVMLGAVRLGALAVNGALPHGSPHLRSGLASASAVIWAVLLAGFLAYHTVLVIEAFIAGTVAVDIISAYRAAQDARREDDRRHAAGPRDGNPV